MKPNELRIGNWVYFTDWPVSDNPVQVERSTLSEDWVKFFASPIPLTKEWLLRFGFEINENQDYEMNFGRKCIEVVECQDDDLGLKYRNDVGLTCNWIDFVDYVHQLQNLVFALTGEELIIQNKVK